MIRRRIALLATPLAVLALLAWLAACSGSNPLETQTDRLVLTVSSQTIEAVDGKVMTRIGLEARVRDETGAAASGTQVSFSTSAGTLAGATSSTPRSSSVLTNGAGVAVESLAVEGTGGSVTVTASTGTQTDSMPVSTDAEETAIASIEASPAGFQIMGNPVIFDGGGSASTVGDITMYRWTITSDSPDPGSDAEEIVEAEDAVTVERTYTTPQNLTVRLEVSDAADAADLLAAGQDVPYGPPTVIEYQILEPNEPPVADAGEDVVAECSGDDSGTVTLDGSLSSDPDSTPGSNDDIETFEWFEDYGLSSEIMLGTGETLEVSFAVGIHQITLVVTDFRGESDTDEVMVEIVDTVAPEGSITFPEDGACFGPDALPVTIQDDFTDVCSEDLTRAYDPSPGPDYSEHGDLTVTLTVTDPSGNAGSDSASFTIDTVEPMVELIRPENGTYINPEQLPFGLFLVTSDDDGAAGEVVLERIFVDDCLIYDGDNYGDGDGLLTDELLEFSTAELCRLNETCNWSELHEPVLRAEAVDCGGNVGVDIFQFNGSIKLLPGECD